jgi:predicted dehydrogenase
MIGIGIVGMGPVGQTHFKSYGKISSAKVVSVADIDPSRIAGDFSGSWGSFDDGAARFMTASYLELIARPEVDVVDICVPTPDHHEIALAALRAGKHVVCEKPLARTAAIAGQVADLAEQSKSFFMTAMCMRFWPQWAWLKKAVVEQRYGKVLSAHFTRLASPPVGAWYRDGKKSGGALLDLHVHDTDFIQFLFGMPRSVSSRGYSGVSGETDHVVTQYVYDDVPLVVAEGGWMMAPAFGFRMRYTVNFEKATADFDLGREKKLLLHDAESSQAVEREAIDGWFAELRYFIECVERREKPSVVTARDAHRSIRIVEAERQSILTGGAMDIL